MTLYIPYVWIVYASIPLTAILAFYATRWAWLIHTLCKRYYAPWWPRNVDPAVQWRSVTRLWFIAKAIYLWGAVFLGFVAIESRGAILLPYLVFSTLRIALWLAMEIWAYRVWLRLPPDGGEGIVHLIEPIVNEQETP